MDDADHAQERIERELEARIAAARGIRPKASDYCADCDVLLPIVRRQFGLCIDCAEIREKRQRLKGGR